LQRDGRLVQAIKRIGRGAETDGRASFVLPVTAQAEIENRAS